MRRSRYFNFAHRGRLRSCFRIGLSLACMASFFSCGKSDSGAKGKTSILLLDTGIEETNQRMWKAAIAGFEKDHVDARIDYRIVKDDDYSQGGVLLAQLRSKNPPDVYFEWAWSAVARDGGNGTALDLTPHLTPELKADFDPKAWAGTEFQGKTYMLPLAYEAANLIFYRRKYLADHQIAIPKTWDEFVESCRALKAAGVQPIFQGNQGAWCAGNWASEIAVHYMGLEKYKQAGEKPPRTLLTDPEFLKSVTLLKQLRDVGAFNEDMNTLNDTEGLAQYSSGKGAFIFAGSWTLDVLTAAGGGEEFGILPPLKLPGAPENAHFILANSAGYMINTKCANPDLAFDLLRHLMTPEVQRIRVKGGLTTTSLSAQKEIESPLQQAIMDSLRAGGEWVAAPDISWNRFTAERFYEAVKQVVGGEAEPLAALQAAAQDVAARSK